MSTWPLLSPPVTAQPPPSHHPVRPSMVEQTISRINAMGAQRNQGWLPQGGDLGGSLQGQIRKGKNALSLGKCGVGHIPGGKHCTKPQTWLQPRNPRELGRDREKEPERPGSCPFLIESGPSSLQANSRRGNALCKGLVVGATWRPQAVTAPRGSARSPRSKTVGCQASLSAGLWLEGGRSGEGAWAGWHVCLSQAPGPGRALPPRESCLGPQRHLPAAREAGSRSRRRGGGGCHWSRGLVLTLDLNLDT